MNKYIKLNRSCIKRSFDILLSFILISVAFPLFLCIAFLIKVDSPGPVFFSQRRLGRNGKLFPIIKFRTMVERSDAIPVDQENYDYRTDARITPIGRILRLTSLDELPQLMNVLMGHMSLVGPRPALPHHLACYTDVQKQRLLIRPGITGLAQVMGRNALSWEEKISYDLEYLERWSLLLDIEILLKTLLVVIKQEGIAMTYKWRS